ncbi:MAG: transglycosylase SLT domain-containing protein [Thermodesulfovibrionales bacterium]|nr:transglycosylase SLT domain-containing protein [Thermodesulfovibrionales bacterium]
MKDKPTLQLLLIFICAAIALLPVNGWSSEKETAIEAVKTDAAQAVEEAVEPQEAAEPSFLDLMFFSPNTHALDAVEKQLNLFSETIKKRFGLYLSRSGKYLGLMQGILAEKGLPDELAFLPLIESGFSVNAKSPMQAVGPWQFIASTGRLYGLKINWWVDERKDPVKSTVAAAEYLSNLYERFGSWGLALAAYNAGEGKIHRALMKAKGSDFWDIQRTSYIKSETRAYVPKFIAATLIADDPGKYGFDSVEYEDKFIFEEVAVSGGVPLEEVAKSAGLTVNEIKELNPELLRACTPPDDKEYRLRIPVGAKEALIANAPAPSKDCNKYKPVLYTVKKGDTLSGISRKTGVPINDILHFNSINKRNKKSLIKRGQVLHLSPKRG